MAKFKVLHPFRDARNGKRYGRNDVIDIGKERGERLISRGLVRAVAEPKQRSETIETAESKAPETAAKRTKAE